MATAAPKVTVKNKHISQKMIKGTVAAVSLIYFGSSLIDDIDEKQEPKVVNRHLEPNISFIKKSSLAYIQPIPNAKPVIIDKAYKEADNNLEIKVNVSSVTEVENGIFDFQVTNLKPLPTPITKIKDMDEFILIEPENVTEVEVANKDFWVPREV